MDFIMLFDNQHSPEGMVCLDSILKKQPDAKVFVLCLTPPVSEAVEKRGGTPIELATFETRYPMIAATKSERPWAPYTQSLKPFLPEYVFDENPEVEVLTYVDSDMYFWGDPQEITEEFGDKSFMVTTRADMCDVYFNGGCFTCRNDDNCRQFLKWWQERCIEWCLWQAGPGGRFGEEGYLNIIKEEPGKFKGTYVNKHPGINAAPWNIMDRDLQKAEDGQLTVQGRPLVCYHYRAYFKYTEVFDPEMLMDRHLSPEVLDMLYLPYHDMLPVLPKPDTVPGTGMQ